MNFIEANIWYNEQNNVFREKVRLGGKKRGGGGITLISIHSYTDDLGQITRVLRNLINDWDLMVH